MSSRRRLCRGAARLARGGAQRRVPHTHAHASLRHLKIAASTLPQAELQKEKEEKAAEVLEKQQSLVEAQA